jgi:hypothetical protein
MLCGSFLVAPADMEDSITGSGLLHHIWLSQCHADKLSFLKDVQQPTEKNLRRRGLISLQLSKQISNRFGLQTWRQNGKPPSLDTSSTSECSNTLGKGENSGEFHFMLCLLWALSKLQTFPLQGTSPRPIIYKQCAFVSTFCWWWCTFLCLQYTTHIENMI